MLSLKWPSAVHGELQYMRPDSDKLSAYSITRVIGFRQNQLLSLLHQIETGDLDNMAPNQVRHSKMVIIQWKQFILDIPNCNTGFYDQDIKQFQKWI